MDTWKLKDTIMSGGIAYTIGDRVIVFRRKGNGYPRQLKDGTTYVVIRLWGESVEVLEEGKDLGSRPNGYKVHKSFLIQKDTYREIKIDELLKGL
jgi:hypothetical protein